MYETCPPQGGCFIEYNSPFVALHDHHDVTSAENRASLTIHQHKLAMPHSQVIVIAVLGLSSLVHSAFTKLSETQMQIYLASNSAGLAQLNAPYASTSLISNMQYQEHIRVFFLGQNRYQPPRYITQI